MQKKEAMALSNALPIVWNKRRIYKEKSANLQKKEEILICDVKSIETDKKYEWSVVSIWYGIVLNA